MIHKKIQIWDKGEYNGANPDYKPWIDTYILNNTSKKTAAVLVLPGGGYSFCSWREAEPIAVWVNSIGYHAFVLNYSVSPNRHPQPLLDVTRAMCIIRDNADQWNIDSDKIAVCGFSAGGHLAASIGTLWNEACLQNVSGMEEGKNKPNALILGYPVISGGKKAHRGSFRMRLGEDATQAEIEEKSLESRVSSVTPKTFIWSTFNDQAVPVENTLLFSCALRENNVPFELHIFPDGVHGLSLATKQTDDGNPKPDNPHVAVWTELCKKWLEHTFFDKD
ncbi:MAG: alpha/beta hydrolase [Clostridiaceae bacterium]|nr:alpha/beta hydrolase [Clostridiaceae bacterium]